MSAMVMGGMRRWVDGEWMVNGQTWGEGGARRESGLAVPSTPCLGRLPPTDQPSILSPGRQRTGPGPCQSAEHTKPEPERSHAVPAPRRGPERRDPRLSHAQGPSPSTQRPRVFPLHRSANRAPKPSRSPSHSARGAVSRGPPHTYLPSALPVARAGVRPKPQHPPWPD